MVERDHDLRRDMDQEIPTQRVGDGTGRPIDSNTWLTDERLQSFFPGKHEFHRKPLVVTGEGFEEIGIHASGYRVDVYDIDDNGKRTALRGVLTSYQGRFGQGNERTAVTIDLVGSIVGDEMTLDLYTSIPDFDVAKYAKAVAEKKIPISTATDKSTGETVLASRSPGGLLMDIHRLRREVGIFDFADRRALDHARRVAEHVKGNFKTERPPDQPGRVKVKGQ